MNSLERVSKTIKFEKPDRVPVYPIMAGVTRQLVDADYKTWATNAEVCAKALIEATEKYNLDILCTLTDLSVEAGDFGAEIQYPELEAAHPNFHNRYVKCIEDYKKVKRVNPRVTERMKEHIKLCDILVKAKGNEVPVVAFIFGPLGILGMLRGAEDLFMDIITDPEEVKEALEEITLTLIDYCDALMETGIHAIMIDTLYSSQGIMSKQMWMEYEGEFVRRIAKHVHDKGCMFMIHNCGNGIYFDVQIETMKPEAISFLHLPDDCATMEEVKEKYGKKTCLIGHVDPPWMVSATKEEILEECRKEIEVYKEDGGFILSTGCEYPVNVEPDKAIAFYEAAEKYGRY